MSPDGNQVSSPVFQVIPAIDLLDGKCVRLYKGAYDAVTTYSNEPSEVARKWARMGAPLVHVVDLDGAKAGYPVNLGAITAISRGMGAPIQVGGGLRSIEHIEAALAAGASRVVIGSRAISDPVFLRDACARFRERIVIGIDANDGMVAVHGWQETTGLSAVDFAKQAQAAGAQRIIFTAIERDGTLEGPGIERLTEVLDAVNIPVISSGGIRDVSHITELLPLMAKGLEGAIVGKSIYEGTLPLEQAIAIAANYRYRPAPHPVDQGA